MNALHTSNPFPSTLNPPSPPSSPFNKPNKLSLVRAASVDDEPNPIQTKTEEKEPPATPPPPMTADQSFENRLANVRLKYRSGTGKKAEKRKSKKSGTTPTGSKKTIMLPPVPLKEPVTAKGLKVELGFTPYSEMVNGRLAGLGLAALLLVEVGSGKGLLQYHPPPVLFLQVYTAVAVSAILIKLEKERISVWPEKTPAVVEEPLE